MSASNEGCCCGRECLNGQTGACCLPPDDPQNPLGCTETLNECECLKRGGIFAGENTSCADKNSCYWCMCCVERGDPCVDDFLWRGGAPSLINKHIPLPEMCPDPLQPMGHAPYDANNCIGSCTVPCDMPESPTGICCGNCFCISGITECACRRLLCQPNASCTQYPGGSGWRSDQNDNNECTEICSVCACVAKQMQDFESANCCSVNDATFFESGTCEAARSRAGDAGWAAILRACSNNFPPPGGGGGGGGGGGRPGVPIPPRPPPARPPCNYRNNKTPVCLYKVWFALTTGRSEDCNGLIEQFDLTFGLSLGTDMCETLDCCSPKSCRDVECIKDYLITKYAVTDCVIGTLQYEESRADICCNSPTIVVQDVYPCDPCPSQSSTTLEIKCFNSRKSRACCNQRMNKLYVNVPALGIKVNGQWGPGYIPAETIEIDLSRYLCEGYDSNHPSCKNQPTGP